MKRTAWWTSLATVAATLVVLGGMAGCTGGSAPKETASPAPGGAATPAAAGKPLRIGVVFDSGGRGDKSFNDSAWAGIEEAKKQYGIEANSVESKSEKDYATNLAALAEQGHDLVIAVGLNQGAALKQVSAEYPDVKFAIVDGDVKAENVRMLKFREEEGSYLVGYLAGLESKSGKIGFVGGMDLPLIRKFLYGYMAGAKAANPKIEVLPPKFTGNWDDVNQAKAAASILYQQGADVVYHAAGRAGLGVIEAAKDARKFAIGVDSNQDDLAKGQVLTSMVKRVDQAVLQTISDLKDGKFTAGEKIYDLKAGGVGTTDFEFTKDLLKPDTLLKLEEVKKAIVEGRTVIPSDPAGLATFAGAK